jgi:hypothetical protein
MLLSSLTTINHTSRADAIGGRVTSPYPPVVPSPATRGVAATIKPGNHAVVPLDQGRAFHHETQRAPPFEDATAASMKATPLTPSSILGKVIAASGIRPARAARIAWPTSW